MRFSLGKFKTFSEQDGLPDNDVFSVVDDQHGRIWMSSNKGIFSVPKRELEAATTRETRSISCRLYGVDDGMRSHECNGGFQAAVLRAFDGALWFPTMKVVRLRQE